VKKSSGARSIGGRRHECRQAIERARRKSERAGKDGCTVERDKDGAMD
jgi:hypothetical protein